MSVALVNSFLSYIVFQSVFVHICMHAHTHIWENLIKAALSTEEVRMNTLMIEDCTRYFVQYREHFQCGRRKFKLRHMYIFSIACYKYFCLHNKSFHIITSIAEITWRIISLQNYRKYTPLLDIKTIPILDLRFLQRWLWNVKSFTWHYTQKVITIISICLHMNNWENWPKQSV
jgi:hypothetical protein